MDGPASDGRGDGAMTVKTTDAVKDDGRPGQKTDVVMVR